jgi:hypothetical protein
MERQALEARVRERAYRLWEQEGRPEGQERAHWHEAERQVMLEAGLGEPSPAGDRPEPPRDERPEPQPALPADPLRRA